MNQLELLSPAGDLEIFKAVVNAGADAVYFGGDLFGARAYAKNFTLDEAREAIEYGHLHGCKSYLTVNTLLKNLEIENKLYDFLRNYVENEIDAFIVQDFGVFNFIRNYFPDTHIHVSTQASVCTAYGAKFFEGLGASRIVTARELSIDEIKSIHSICPELEIESFVHGALCVCYSGQCLMSSILGGRSGNRGRCAQPCRLPYEAFDNNGLRLNKKGSYLLSPKDFCTIEALPQMIEAGVTSFKIEGRMKQLEYAAGVVSIYRHYLDKYLYKGPRNYAVSHEDINRLLDLGNRSGFTSLYLTKHNGPEMISLEAPAHTKGLAEAISFKEQKIKLDCRVKALAGKAFEIAFTDENGNEASATSGIVERAHKRASSREEIVKAVSSVGNTNFMINKLTVDFDDDIFLPVSVIKNTRREALGLLTERLINQPNRTIRPFSSISENNRLDNHQKPKCFITLQTREQLFNVAKYSFVDSIAVPKELMNDARAFFKGQVYVYMPPIMRAAYTTEFSELDLADGVLVASYDELGLLAAISYPKDKIILDYRLYTFNNRSINSFEAMGLYSCCAPYELSLKELKHRYNHNSQLIIYSRIPMMITANCTVKNTIGCDKASKSIILVDRKNEQFTVACNCTYCYNTIYNSKKYIAFDLAEDILQLSFKELRLDFTIEDGKETEQILEAFDRAFNKGMSFTYPENYTKGHLKRGVE